ncbi:MAG: alpha/beta fold hydrolase [Lachnospiraceae bacterium]
MFVQIEEVKIFFEKSGKGQPILLLHGNGEDHTIFRELVQKLSRQYSVYAIDSRNHGQSSSGHPISYDAMMQDMYGLIRELRLEKPILLGFSDGGITGLLLAQKYPELLDRLIVCGANMYPSGMKKWAIVLMALAYLTGRKPEIKMMLTEPHMKAEELAGIRTATHVLAGSRDLIRTAHTKALAECIQGSTLAILQGETHSSYVLNNEKLYRAVASCLT